MEIDKTELKDKELDNVNGGICQTETVIHHYTWWQRGLSVLGLGKEYTPVAKKAFGKEAIAIIANGNEKKSVATSHLVNGETSKVNSIFGTINDDWKK